MALKTLPNGEGQKFCCSCKAWKSIEFKFHRNRRRKDGASSTCKECTKEYHRKWYAARADQEKARVKKYKKDNPEKRNMWARQYRKRKKALQEAKLF